LIIVLCAMFKSPFDKQRNVKQACHSKAYWRIYT